MSPEQRLELKLYYVSKLISLIPSYRGDALWAHCDRIERLLGIWQPRLFA